MEQPRTLAQYIDAIREGLVCERCGAYVGSLAPKRFLPAPYPVAVGDIGPDDEAEALISFEWHLAGEIRTGKYVIRHPERDGACVTYREWIASDEDEDRDDEELDENVGGGPDVGT